MAALSFIDQFPVMVLVLVFPPILNMVNGLDYSNLRALPYPACLDCLEYLAHVDLKIVEILQFQFQEFTKPVEGATDYIDDATAGFGAALSELSEEDPSLSSVTLNTKKVENISQNPISAYRLIFRFVRKFPKVVKSSPDFLRVLRRNLPENLVTVLDHPPTKNDLLEAALGILRMQMTYNISSNDLTKGHLISIATGVTLNPHHCYHLGVVAWRKLRNYPLAFQWFSSALDLLGNTISTPKSGFPVNPNPNNNNPDPEIGIRRKLEAEIESAITRHNQDFMAGIPEQDEKYTSLKAFSGGQLFPSPLIMTAPNLLNSNFSAALKKYWNEHSRKNEASRIKMLKDLRRFREEILWNPDFPRHSDLNPKLLKFSYDELCSGRDYILEVEKSRLFCWLEREVSPYYKIGPMKMELLSKDPGAVQVYDLVPLGEIQEMESDFKRMENRFFTGLIPQNTNGEKEVKNLDIYTAMETVFEKEENISWNSVFIHGKELFGFSRETHSFNKYTFMGRILPHIDVKCQRGSFCDPEEKLTNYIVYLTDVALGGNTIFPLAGVSVRPVKGSALLFFNLYGDLDANVRSTHAGCPPILGKRNILVQVSTALPLFKKWKCPAGKRGQPFQFKVNGVLNYGV